MKLRDRIILLCFSVIAVCVLSGKSFAFTAPQTSGGVGSGVIASDSANNLSIGSGSPAANTKLLIVASSSDPSGFAVKILQSNGGPLVIVRNDGAVEFGIYPSSTATLTRATPRSPAPTSTSTWGR